MTALLNVDCGITRLRSTAQAFPGTFCFTIFPRWRSRKWWCWVRTVFSLNVDYRKFLLRGQYWQRVFLSFVYSQLLLAFSDLLFPCMSCGIVIFTIVLSLYCNYLSSHVQNSIPQLPCKPDFLTQTHTFQYFPTILSVQLQVSILFRLKCEIISKSTCSTSFQCCSMSSKVRFCSKPF